MSTEATAAPAGDATGTAPAAAESTTDAKTSTDSTSTAATTATAATPANDKPAAESTAPTEAEDFEAKYLKLQNQYAELKSHSRKHEQNVKQLLSEKTEWTTTRSSLEEKLATFNSELQEKNATLTKLTVDSLKTKTAHEFGIPVEAAFDFFRGETEDEIKSEAEKWLKYNKPAEGAKTPAPPVIKTQGTEKGNGTMTGTTIEELSQFFNNTYNRK